VADVLVTLPRGTSRLPGGELPRRQPQAARAFSMSPAIFAGAVVDP
jgi:hypothetical protein